MENNVINRVWNQNRMVTIEDLKGMIFQAESGGHTFQISGVDDAGNIIALSGSVAGVFLRPDNTDVAITGSASGGVVSVTLPANCYDVPGRFGLTVFVTANGQKTAVYAAMGTVSRTSSGTVSPGTTSDVVDLINQINAAVATIPASWTGLMADIAPIYSDTAVYPVGAYVYYNGDLYRCITAITTAESWTAEHWTAAVLGNDVSDIMSAISAQTGAEKLSYITGKYIDLSGDIGSVVNIDSPVPYSNTKYTVQSCQSGDIFTVYGNGGNAPRLWAFLDSSKKILTKSPSSGVVTDHGLLAVAPENAAYFVSNSTGASYMAYDSYKGQHWTPDNAKSDLSGILTDNYNNHRFKNVLNPALKQSKAVNSNDGRIITGTGSIYGFIPIPSGATEITVSYKNTESVISSTGCIVYFYDIFRNYIGYHASEEGISIPDYAKYFICWLSAVYDTSAANVMAEFSATRTTFEPYQSTDARFGNYDSIIQALNGGTDYTGLKVANRWYTGTTVGSVITESTANNTCSVILPVSENDGFIVSCKGGSGGRAYYLLDSNSKIIDMSVSNATLTDYLIVIPSGVSYLIVQTNNTTVFKLVNAGSVLVNESNIDKLFNKTAALKKNESVYKTSVTKYGSSKLAKMKITGSGIVDVGFIGDSWTQGTEDSIVSGKYEGYVKWLSKKLWDRFGFGGLGWLDFGRDNGSGKLFGCSDMYEHWTYAFSGTVSGVDGSSSTSAAAQCLGICCAHTIFSNGASLTLTFDAGYLDKFEIAYYKNAHFSVAINDGTATEITANSLDGWQTTQLSTTGTDTVKVVITSLANDSIIFGMNCFYGSTGVRCHKIGNRSISLARCLLMDGTQFEDGLKTLNLSWVSLLFAINDIGQSASDDACLAILANFTSFINRIKAACTRSDLMSCDISLLGCANISNSGYTYLPRLEEFEHDYAVENGYGWCSTRECIGANKAELAETGLFSDEIHLNKIGSSIFGDYIYRQLFQSIGICELE